MISFVVPAYNEEKYLAATLASIHAAAGEVGEPYEIVVADDASTDATAEIAEQGGARVVSVQKRQISATRNAGARAGKGNRLIFVDADTHVNAAVIRAACEAMADGVAGGGAGVRFDHAPWWMRWMMEVLVLSFRWARLAAGCFIYARRDAFEAAGGFDEKYFAAEELFLSQALKRVGPFVVLRERVTTSARKFRGMSLPALTWLVLRTLARGPAGTRKRETTKFWYPEKRT